MNATSHRTALVVAGGGAAGNAWALGVLAGLLEHGIDAAAADLVVGTSSGATVAAQITSGAAPDALYAAILSEPVRPPAQGAPIMSGQSYLDWSNALIAASTDAADMRRRIAAAARERDTSDGEQSRRWREITAQRLPRHDWPDRGLLITALDARTAEPVVFDRGAGVDLVDAVAASTSAMIPYRIGDDRYLNGSYRRGENADLARGYDHVLVLVPFGGRTRVPGEWGMGLSTQEAELRASGSTVVTVFPDAETSALFDANALDPSTRPPAARGGHAQGRALGRQLGDW